LIDLAFVESNLTMSHRISESTFSVAQYIREHILHCVFVDLFCSMMVDCKNNGNLGMLWSLMMFLDDLGQAIANPSCEGEALAAQECCMVWFVISNLN
jgi:hypothetical protein